MNGQVKTQAESGCVRSAKVLIGIESEKKYMTNRPPCRKCGLTIRNTSGKCPDCSKKRTDAYYEKHKKKLNAQRKVFSETLSAEEKKIRNRKYKLASQEKHIGRSQAQSRARYAADPAKHKAYTDKYRENNIEKVHARDNKWVRINPKKVKTRNDAYRAANLEKERARNAAWAKENRDNVQMRCALRRARKLNAKTEIFLRTEIFERDKWICQLCHKKVNKKLKHPEPLSASIDHIIPLSRGGSHTRVNTHLAHLICNEKASVGGVKQLLMFG